MYLLITVMVFGQTLSVHPAVTALIVSSGDHSVWSDEYYLLVTCFLVQAVCDWLGRSLATLTQWPRLGRSGKVFLIVTAALRTGFLPLIMKCNVLPGVKSIYAFINIRELKTYFERFIHVTVV